MGKRGLVTLLSLSSWCLVIVVWDFLAVLCDCLQFVIVVFPDHTHLLFLLIASPCYLSLTGVHVSVIGLWLSMLWHILVGFLKEKRYLGDHVKYTCRVPFMMVWLMSPVQLLAILDCDDEALENVIPKRVSQPFHYNDIKLVALSSRSDVGYH